MTGKARNGCGRLHGRLRCPSLNALKRVVIVGGGTTGWLAALLIRTRLLNAGIQVTVVESPQIPTVGVGEGSTGLLTSTIRNPKYGLNEADFISASRATLKLGIIHRDWRFQGHSYFGPIDTPGSLIPACTPNGFPMLQAFAVSRGLQLSDTHLNGRLMRTNKAPVFKGKRGIEVLTTYGFHFDAGALAGYLSDVCRQQGIGRVERNVAQVVFDGLGWIRALVCDDGHCIPGDFFVDCSGFARVLIGKIHGAGWHSYRSSLPLDSALTFFLPHASYRDIPIATVAQAMKCGWLWKIPTQDRMGCGYVFCSQIIDPLGAKKEIETIIRQPIEVRQIIRFESGRLIRFWHHNCVALGLAAAFTEPLEATSIHATLLQLLLLCEHYMDEKRYPVDENSVASYNGQVAAIYDDFRDFLVLHYCTQRQDSEFWRRVARNGIKSEALQRRLQTWKREFPTSEHFVGSSGAVSADLYGPILDGLGLFDRRVARMSLKKRSLSKIAKECHSVVSALYDDGIGMATSHRHALEILSARTYGEKPCLRWRLKEPQ